MGRSFWWEGMQRPDDRIPEIGVWACARDLEYVVARLADEAACAASRASGRMKTRLA
jgi:hypothetical protein